MLNTRKKFHFSIYLVFLTLASCSGEKKSEPEKAPAIEVQQQAPAKKTTVVDIKTTAKFDEIRKEKPSVVKFHATWCGPCKAMKIIFEAVAKKYSEKKINFGEINIDSPETKDLVKEYVKQGVPTFVFFDKHGKPAKTIVGGTSKEKLESAILEIIE